jgi:diguanylate cyclase (GGDEF)-like protein
LNVVSGESHGIRSSRNATLSEAGACAQVKRSGRRCVGVEHRKLRTGEELLAARTSLSHVLTHLARATAGLAVAFIVAGLIVDRVAARQDVVDASLWIALPVHLAMAGLALTLTSAIPIVRDLLVVKRLVMRNESDLEQRSVEQTFLRDVNTAFEMVDNEAELFDISAVALGEVARDEVGGSEVLVADSSVAHLRQSVVSAVGTAPGCAILTPGACPAVRGGRTLKFDKPNGLAACPRLRERHLPDGMGSTCVPITILGTPSAVLHATYTFIEDEAEYEKQVGIMEGLAGRFGARLGMLRAMSLSRLQADSDPLTGLLNRRAMENRVRDLRNDGEPFALAMIDLDRFKNLNDTFGHDTGDRALRLFSRTLSEALRDTDIVCRYGGEEFIVVLPGGDVRTAAPVLHRLRERLANTLADSQVPSFTTSIGLCDSTWADDLQLLINAADRALMTAKHEGRDRLVIDDPPVQGAAAREATGDDQDSSVSAGDDATVSPVVEPQTSVAAVRS